MSKIEEELQKATGVKASKDRAAYLKKLHTGAMALSEDDWDKLSPAAQNWANAATKSIEAKTALVDFAVAKAKAEPEAEVEDTEEATEEEAPAAKPKGAAKPAAAKTAAKPVAEAKPKAAPKEKVKKGPGKIEKMKGIILKNMSDKPEDLKAKLIAAGVEVQDSTITTVRSDFMSSLRVLKKAGKLEEKLAAKILVD